MSSTTAYSALAMLARMTGGTLNIDPLTTLNTFHNLNAAEVADSFNDIKLQYIAIGAGGHILDCANDEILETPRSPLKAVLYKQLPFAVVMAGEVAPASYASDYRMKVTKNNNDYYFLKRIDLSNVTPTIHKRDITSPATTAVDVDLTLEDIQDTTKPTDAMVANASSNILTVDLPVVVSLTAAEFVAIKEAAASFYGTPVNTMSEISICTGAEKTIDGVQEAVQVQLGVVESENIKLSNALTDYRTTITLGTQDALYVS